MFLFIFINVFYGRDINNKKERTLLLYHHGERTLEIVWDILTYVLIALGVWCGLVAFATTKIMKLAIATRGSVRKSDKIKLYSLIGSSAIIGFILFIYPGLIYTAPSAVAALEVAILPLLFHLSETQYKNWKRLKTLSHA